MRLVGPRRACCPICGDERRQRASLSLSSFGSVGICFRCGFKGSVLDLHARLNGISIGRSIRELAIELGLAHEDGRRRLPSRGERELLEDLRLHRAALASRRARIGRGLDAIARADAALDGMCRLRVAFGEMTAEECEARADWRDKRWGECDAEAAAELREIDAQRDDLERRAREARSRSPR